MDDPETEKQPQTLQSPSTTYTPIWHDPAWAAEVDDTTLGECD